MPNIVGIWDPGSSEHAIQSQLKRQLRRVQVPNIRYEEYTTVHPGLGVGLQDHGILENVPQPIRTQDGRISLFMDGEIYNSSELKKRFRKEIDTSNLTDLERECPEGC